jgi:hypothetical protein
MNRDIVEELRELASYHGNVHLVEHVKHAEAVIKRQAEALRQAAGEIERMRNEQR